MLMLLAFHIAIAMLSIAVATAGVVRPSNVKLRLSYYGTAITLSSGTALAVLQPSSRLHACISGGLFLLAILPLTTAANRRLAYQTTNINNS